MARPQIDPFAVRWVRITVRLSPEEDALVRENSAAVRMHPSAFLRAAALGQALPSPVPEINRTAWEQLSRLASNLNQLAHAANAGQPVAVDAAQLRELGNLLTLVRRRLIGS